MTRTEFKRLYSEYRSIRFHCSKASRNAPCGTQDYYYDCADDERQAIAEKYPAIGQVIKNLYDTDDILACRAKGKSFPFRDASHFLTFHLKEGNYYL